MTLSFSIELSKKIKAKAFNLGFELCRIIPYTRPRYKQEYINWLDQKLNAQMKYLEITKSIRLNPQMLVDDYQTNSIIIVAKKYDSYLLPALITQHPDYKKYGRIASYVLTFTNARDYHRVIKKKLLELDHMICASTQRKTRAKCLVDSGPVLERDLAETAGLGFIGKNTCLINQKLGSWFIIASIWLPEVFSPKAYDQISSFEQKKNYKVVKLSDSNDSASPTAVGSCGSCDRCLRMCPTNALSPDQPYILDANKCISYWTIETKDNPDKKLAEKFNNWVFGCDICQNVCPWNMRLDQDDSENTPKNSKIEDYIFPYGPLILLEEGFNPKHPYLLDDDAFIEKFNATPIMRAGRKGMFKNITNAIQNAKSKSSFY